MNERIKELVEQATPRPYRSQGFGGEPTHIYPGTLDQVKFAELIVRECVEICDNTISDLDGWYAACKQIREHFGVES